MFMLFYEKWRYWFNFEGWTRISEYKHSPNQPEGTKDLPGTVIYKVLQEGYNCGIWSH